MLRLLISLLACAPIAGWESRELGGRGGYETGQAPGGPTDIRTAIERSTDVAWLERVVRAQEEAGIVAPGGLAGGLNDLRTAAYARLGSLATPESLAAVRRIDAAIVANTDLTPATVPATEWIHPAWHFGATTVIPVAQTTASDGTTFAIVPGVLLGATDLFLISSRTPADRASWTRPLLLPVRWYDGATEVTLEWEAPDRLVLRYVQAGQPPRAVMDGMPERAEAPGRGRLEQTLELSRIRRDSDEDGWTDLEEVHLGLDPRRADTDGDERKDGQDCCPNHVARGSSPTDTEQILQRALFAVFSVGGSRAALLVEPGTEPVDLEGYGGPILYEVGREQWLASHGHGGVFVAWRIESRRSDEAVVEITDWEGMLAAGGQKVTLRRIGGEWIVVSRIVGWVA